MTCSLRTCCARISQRLVFTVMACLAVTNAYTMRLCLYMAITEMVQTKHPTSNLTRTDQVCPASETLVISNSARSGGTYQWDEYTQGIILSSFFWGMLLTPIPGGILSKKFGGKYVLGLGIFSTAVCTLLTPIVVHVYDSTGLIVLRALMGLGEGATFPALYILIAQWAPPLERSKIGSAILTGKHFGSILGTALSGILIQNSSIGWPMVFYVFGAGGVLWFIAWVILCYNHPDDHPFISETEKMYLHETMKKHTHKQSPPTPWRHILTSAPFWAFIAGSAGHAFGLQLLLNNLPRYMSHVLNFPIQANGLLTALPNICMWLVASVSSWHADWLIKNEKMSRTNVRKMFSSIAKIGPAIFMVAASYAGCNQTIAVVLFTISLGSMGPCYPGLLVNPLDLSPNYFSSLKALFMIAVSVTGSLVPYVIGILAPNQGLLEWRIVFWIASIILLVSTIIFIIWADGEVQYWNNLSPEMETCNEIELKERVRYLDDSMKPQIMLTGPEDQGKF